MTKESEREIRSETEYISKNGQLIKKVTTYSIVSGATFKVENDDSPTITEFRKTMLNESEANKDGYISSNEA
jgi:hypothetical protein